MALGKRCSTSLRSKRGGLIAEEALGLGFLRFTGGLGRKRVLVSNDLEDSPIDSAPRTPPKKQCAERMVLDAERSSLEALPQDILIRVLCGVNHEDLKHLFHVSKVIREATLIAKQSHFAYSTPSKTRAFRTTIDLEDSNEFDDKEAPNAPKLSRRCKPRLSKKKLADISVALFSSMDEEQWPRKSLFMETEI
ncbi:F-box protein SKIP27 [Juglans microcarpa x Juglans regia]|uniref:F-box protein SKIP27 n=1 Tax=Juglans microcarpa x Juglans regia TaxID=2249226 RepID=UPI001B7E8158|nr:F-box protein SKIP27 [Juglans microcarpa x Juglans regia]